MTKMEFLDIVDINDNIIGKSSKKEIYGKKLRHRIVHIVVFNNKNELGLQLRANHVSYCPSYWATSACGHVQSGESYEEAALREYKEELGTTSILNNFKKDTFCKENNLDKFLGIFETIHNGQFYPNPKEVEKIEFFSLKQIKEMINNGEKFHPELLFILEKYYF